MNIAFFWTGVTAPLVSCWKALASHPDVRLKVFVELARRDDSAFNHEEMLAGIDAEVRYAEEKLDRDVLWSSIFAFRPDVIVVIGWRSPMVRCAVECQALESIPKIFAFDMPFAWTLRKMVAPIVLRPYLRRFKSALVPGQRSARYARHLGFRPEQIDTGLISLDLQPFAEANLQRQRHQIYPRTFLYVGRYAPEKRIDVLVEAYRRYRKTVQAPWRLTCCGMGPSVRVLVGEEGVRDIGFVQPKDLPAVYAAHGAFVITSDYEPWGMVIAEAAASGLPIICTDACGAHPEIVRMRENGIICGNHDVKAIADAMSWMHEHEDALPSMGARSIELASPFSSAEWVQRVLRRCRHILHT